ADRSYGRGAQRKQICRVPQAMLAADPTIEIVATGKGDEFVGAGICRCDRWNHELLEAARSDGRQPDHVSIHPLVPLPGNLSGKPYGEVYNATMAHPHWLATARLPELMASIWVSKLAVTEWGIIHGGPDWLRYPNHDSQSGAVYAALLFHAMFRCADSISIS